MSASEEDWPEGEPDGEPDAEPYAEEEPPVDEKIHPFARLSPDLILEAIDSTGHCTDGRVLALNSYENRVYQIGIDDGQPLVAKFYRPRRWSDAQILEEHQLTHSLQEHELPVVAPWQDSQQQSLFDYDGFRFALYPRKGGHAPELDNLHNLEIMGRVLGRMHNFSRSQPFRHRPTLDSDSFGHDSADLLLDCHIPDELADAYDNVSCELLNAIDDRLEDIPAQHIAVHGDCHVGNVLWRDDNPHFVDFDDARMAPAVQDIWMLLCGEPDRQQAQLEVILRGYRQFCDFDSSELQLIECYRSLRIMHYAAWLARRWDDPAFPPSFPWFGSSSYWHQHIHDLNVQLEKLKL